MIPTLTEFLVEKGKIARRYLIDQDRHTPEILDLWRPLVQRLLDRPGERQYHGLVGLPYWDASMQLSSQLRHPDLEDQTWICFYAGPKAAEPYYVGLITTKNSPIDTVINGAMLIEAVSAKPGDGIALAQEIVHEAPNLCGAYWPMGFVGVSDPRTSARSTGECAAILAQLIVEALGG